MRADRLRTRRVVLLAAAAFVVVVSAVVAVVSMCVSGHRPSSAPSSKERGAVVHRTPGQPGGGLRWHAEPPVASSGSPIQQEGNQAFTQGLSGSGLGALSHLEIPAPGIEGGWPALPQTTTPEAWTTEFTSGLLDVDFARQSRSDLGRWLVAEEAPLRLPGVPTSAADKVLYASVLEPGLAGGGESPIPSVTTWQQDAKESITWSVADLVVQVDPSWSRLVASGWQPPDPRMTVEDVSGLFEVRQGQTTSTRHFRLALGIGSARWHPGYGTIAVGGFSEASS